ncbi:MAG: glycosyltransferase family 39 protein [Sphingomonadaceae bacterium]
MARDKDPQLWCALIALAFGGLCAVRLAIPSAPYFDETHYLKAARALLLLEPANREHPMFAKELIAASVAVLGDGPLAWRLPSLLAGTAGLYAFSRLVWHLTRERFATLAAAILLATSFLWFVQSRIAMLDMVAAGLAMVSLWQISAAFDGQRKRALLHLAASGIAMGLAMGSKWSVLPLAVMPALGFFVWRTRLQKVSLVQAALLLGLLPLFTYWLTFLPAMFYAQDPVQPLGWVETHRRILALQESVRGHHPYASHWYDWIVNHRPIWYLFEPIDDAQRGIVMLGNPLTMLAGLPALLWCGWQALRHKRKDAGAFALLFAASLLPWLLPTKPVQFYYYYLLPGAFLMACLALWLGSLWQRGGWTRAVPPILLTASAALFAWFYPILSAAPLASEMAFMRWMWLASWI